MDGLVALVAEPGNRGLGYSHIGEKAQILELGLVRQHFLARKPGTVR